jgi:hypothetical protein
MPVNIEISCNLASIPCSKPPFAERSRPSAIFSGWILRAKLYSAHDSRKTRLQNEFTQVLMMDEIPRSEE